MTIEENGDITRMEGTISGNVLIMKRRTMTDAQRKEAATRLKRAREARVNEA
jgi:hypothetical protein